MTTAALGTIPFTTLKPQHRANGLGRDTEGVTSMQDQNNSRADGPPRPVLRGDGRMAEMRAQLHWSKSRSLNISDARDHGFVYFIAADDGPVKIGYAQKDISKRLSDLQCGSPVPLRLLAFIPGGKNEERRWHLAMREHRSHREWFDREAVLAALAERGIPLRGANG